MNARINYGIETYRKGRANVTVRVDGKPCEGAKIKFTHKKHEFKFGANCFMIDELETPEKNAEYKRLFADAFNLATVPFYWKDLEPVKGSPRYAADSPKIYRRPAPDLCIDFCHKNGIEPKLHCLNYDIFAPDWYRSASVPEQKKMLEAMQKNVPLQFHISKGSIAHSV